jgi:hypothetical protein
MPDRHSDAMTSNQESDEGEKTLVITIYYEKTLYYDLFLVELMC